MAKDPIEDQYEKNNNRFDAPDDAPGPGNVHQLKLVPLELRPAEPIDPKLIPPRQWLYGRALVRSFVSVLVAPGGTGKSLWAMVAGVSLATGISLLGERVYARTNVWLINLDDPMDELNRRFAAVRLHYRLQPDEWEGRFYMNSGEERGLFMAEMKLTEDGFAVVHPDEEALERHILDNAIGLLIVDPFAESHSLEENSNPQMVAATAAWRRVARRTRCSILLVHHVRKGSSGDIESARGAKALTDSARVGLVMSTMSTEEAEALGIEEEHRLSYVRLDDAKANLAPRAGVAKWFKLGHLELDNGTPEYPEGDQVAVMMSWQPPTPWEALDAVTLGRIFDRLEKGPEPGERYAMFKQAKERWAGHAIIEIAGITPVQAASVIAQWKKNEVISEGTYSSTKQKGRERGCIIINQARAAMMRNGTTAEIAT
jgi:hypothetical protein